MNSDDFRTWAHRLVDWMADYLENVDQRDIVPDVEPGEIRSQLPDKPPERGESFETIFRDFRETIVPGMTHWNHPGWFAYFPANNSPPSILGEMLMATLGAQCMSWETSPAATELEEVVTGWLADMLDLPDGFTGVIQDTASTATLVALLTAREKATDDSYGNVGGAADDAGRLTVYTSDQAHSSIAKAVKLAGLGLDRLRLIESDDEFAMRPGELRRTIEADLEDGLVPAAVCATVGTTSSTALDSLTDIGPVCDEHDIWLHVDAAYAGSAAILPEKRHILEGIEHADSFVFNPHKWLLTNFDCSAYFVRDVDALLRTFQANPEYLKTAHDADVRNFRDWGIQLGRRFRALKLWFVLRSYGVEGLRELLRSHLELAKELRGWVVSSPHFEPVAPTPLGLVCFRWVPSGIDDDTRLDELNADLLETVNADGSVYLTHTKLRGRYTLRMSIGQWMTRDVDIERAWRLITDAADQL